MNWKKIYVKQGDGDWTPAEQAELNVRIEGISTEEFYKVWPVSVLEPMLKSYIEDERYEHAGMVNKILEERKLNATDNLQ